MNQVYMAIDIETTGLNPDEAKIIEIGAVVIKDTKEIARFSRLIQPCMKLPERIVELTGITDKMLLGQEKEREVIHDFLNFCEETMGMFEEKDLILGHNVSFDYSFIKTAATRANLSFERRALDTLRISRRCHMELPSKNLDSMCAYYNIVREVSHRAIEDAIASAQLYEKLKENFLMKDPDAFVPEQMHFKPKKQEPMTQKQKKYLLDLISYHRLTVPEDLEEFTKSKASKTIDRIIFEHGLLFRK